GARVVAQAGGDPAGRAFGGAGPLGEGEPAHIVEGHDVGEGAADIDADLHRSSPGAHVTIPPCMIISTERPSLASPPDLLVLDFDGVVCDGMEEFFESAWRAWQRLDGDRLPVSRRVQLGARVAKLRRVVEAGWEMALWPALLATTDPSRDAELADAARWPAIRDAWVRERGVAPQRLADALDEARDAWRREDRDEWLRRHRFY